jgi:hypothetical protein
VNHHCGMHAVARDGVHVPVDRRGASRFVMPIVLIGNRHNQSDGAKSSILTFRAFAMRAITSSGAPIGDRRWGLRIASGFDERRLLMPR